MNNNEHWHWQERGTAWKGVGIYHITLTIPTREPLLGTLIIPDNDPAKAYVERTVWGDALVDCLLSIPTHHPEVQVLHFCLMPDHLHALLYVRRTMQKSIRELVRGFWQATKQLGRAASYQGSSVSSSVASSSVASSSFTTNTIREVDSSFVVPNVIRANFQEEKARFQSLAAALRSQLGVEAYYRLPSLFTEMPFIRPMGQRRQLPATIRYIDMNPQRLATKRLMPGFFRVQRGVEIGGRSYDAVGNIALLQAEHFAPVHVRRLMVEAAEHGDTQPLRDYMNGCVLAARRGIVMVSPFISSKEKDIMNVFLRESLPFIYLADNGFGEYYKPQDALFDACAAGRVLILCPWQHDPAKRHITRADCITLNTIAEEICQAY